MVSVLGLVIVVCFLQAKGDACGVLTINDGKDDGASLLKKTISAFNQKCRAGCVDSAKNPRILFETWVESCDECICTTDGPSCAAIKCEKDAVLDFPADACLLYDETGCCPISIGECGSPW